MTRILFAAHSGWRWLALLAVVAALGFGLWGWLGKQSWRETGRKIMLAAAIAIDIQLLLGIALYVAGSYWNAPTASVRFAHPLMMFIALFAVHGVYKRVKTGSGDGRYKTMALGTLGVLVLVVLGVMALGDPSRLFRMTPMG